MWLRQVASGEVQLGDKSELCSFEEAGGFERRKFQGTFHGFVNLCVPVISYNFLCDLYKIVYKISYIITYYVHFVSLSWLSGCELLQLRLHFAILCKNCESTR